MADIRINALATTAASTASDDFVAVDGSANGTRKLNAYSPTFGGNLTVSGDASVGTSVFKIDSTNTRILLGLASALQGDTLEIQSKSNAGAISLFGRASDNQSVIAFRSNGSNTQKASIQGGDAGISLVTGLTAKLSIDSAGATTLAGNLTVSGTGPHSFSGRISVTNASGAYAGSLINTDATTAPGLYVQASRTTDSALLVRNASDSSDLLKVTNSGGTVIGGNLTVSGGTIGTAASTNLTLAGGSSGASLVLGQGTNGGATITGKGAGGILLTNPVAAVTTIERTGLNTVGPAGILSIQSDAKTANDALRLSFFAKDSADNAQLYGVLETEITDATSTSEDSNLSFYSARAGSLTKQATLTSTGNLIIGSPFTDGGQKLQVNGTAYVSSDITSGSIIRSSGATNTIRVRGNSQYVDFTNLAENAYVNGTIIANTLSLFGDNGTGLSIGATGNATFAGTVTAGGGSASSATLTVNYTSVSKEPIGIANSASGGKTWYIGDGAGVSAGTFGFRNATNGVNAFTISSTGNGTLAGSLTTSAPTGGAGAWELGVYTATAPTATGYVTIEIGGTQYKLLAATA